MADPTLRPATRRKERQLFEELDAQAERLRAARRAFGRDAIPPAVFPVQGP